MVLHLKSYNFLRMLKKCWTSQMSNFAEDKKTVVEITKV